MDRFWRLSVWISRAALTLAAFDFGLPAVTSAMEPVLMAWNRGIGMWTPTAITAARVQFSAYPIAVTAIALYCMAVPRRFLVGLSVVASFSTAILVGYIAGLVLEGVTARSLLLAERHATATAVYCLALAIEWRRRLIEQPVAEALQSADA